MVLDLDQLKSINDRHGHLAGDTCLKHFLTEVDTLSKTFEISSRWLHKVLIHALIDWLSQQANLSRYASPSLSPIKVAHAVSLLLTYC